MFEDMSSEFGDWMEPARVTLIKDQKVVDGEVSNTTRTKDIQIIIYPMKPQEVMMKPEGERSWKWFTGISAANLEPGDFMEQVSTGLKYKVMGRSQHRQGNFNVYEMVDYYEVPA